MTLEDWNEFEPNIMLVYIVVYIFYISSQTKIR